MSPATSAEWIMVGNARAIDAEHIHAGNKLSVGSFYVAGYAIECSLKALLLAQGTKPPTGGREGHNLRALWKASGLKLSDLQDEDGSRAFYLTNWSTDYRYVQNFACPYPNEALVRGAKIISSRIQTFIRRKVWKK